MGNSRYIKNIFKGVMISIIITMFLLLLLSFLMMVYELSESSYNLIFGIATTISLCIGSVIAAKYNSQRGYLTGMFTGLIFFIFIFFLSSLINGGVSLNKEVLFLLLINLVIGTISGMLGVNL